MSELHFFDCNASFGRRSVRLPGSPYQKGELLEKMDLCGIERALVYHAMSKELDPLTGNGILMEALSGEPRLTPLWAVLPHYTEEFWEPQRLLDEMKAQGVRGVTMFPAPGCQNFSVSEITCGALFRALESAHIPLFLGLDQLGGSVLAAAPIAEAHPQMPIVLTNVNYRIDRDLYPLMAQYQNIYLETSGYKPLGGVAALCKHFGAHRLLFGTGLPQISAAAGISLVVYAEIRDEEKELIASKNLETLLGGVLL